MQIPMLCRHQLWKKDNPPRSKDPSGSIPPAYARLLRDGARSRTTMLTTSEPLRASRAIFESCSRSSSQNLHHVQRQNGLDLHVPRACRTSTGVDPALSTADTATQVKTENTNRSACFMSFEALEQLNSTGDRLFNISLRLPDTDVRAQVLRILYLSPKQPPRQAKDIMLETKRELGIVSLSQLIHLYLS